MPVLLDHLPHRHPFLMVDKLLEQKPGVSAVAEKLVTYSEPFFPGHFPGRPIVPGVLLVEMLAQTSAFLEPESLQQKEVFLAQILDARFQASARPGDRLRLEVKLESRFASLTRVEGKVSCEGKTLCTAKLLLKTSEAPCEES